MKISKYFFYIIFIFIIFGVPLYAFGRIILPDWIVSELKARLPQSSILSIEDINSDLDLNINYKNVKFQSGDGNLKIQLDNLIVSPQLNFIEPLVIKSNEAILETKGMKARFTDFKAKISINYKDISNPKIIGQMHSFKADEIAAISNIEFLLMGLNSTQNKINLEAEDFNLQLTTPNGPINILGEGVLVNTLFKDNISAQLTSNSIKLDFGLIQDYNYEKSVSGDNLNLEFKLLKEKTWSLPIELTVKNIFSKNNHIAEQLNLKAKGKWRNSLKDCTAKDLFINNNKCGKLTDVLMVDTKVIDNESIINFEGNGFCVTPNAGCPQKIRSFIGTNRTTELFSKIMSTNLINPIFGGLVLGSLLSSPQEEGSEFEHKVDFEVNGSRIKVNGKKIF